MTMPCRSWWRNCALQADAEILAIDSMEDRIAPVDAEVAKIRRLIGTLELCHHKAERWVDNIIEAIGSGETEKGLGTRPAGRQHPRESVWKNACTALAAWCAGCPASQVDYSIGMIPASRLLAGLGERTPLKEWQVHRVIEKIRSLIDWPRPLDDPAASYEWLLLSVGEYDFEYLDRCPERYREHQDFWRETALTIVHDTENGGSADLSLALAIDMLWPCNWRFEENLRIVLDAIGGNLDSAQPFAACGRNIAGVPIRRRMEIVCDTLRIFGGDPDSGREVDRDALSLLGQPTPSKQWLAASLDKTIRLQLDPPADLRAISAMAGPDWIR
jgi:hypothetical protein